MSALQMILSFLITQFGNSGTQNHLRLVPAGLAMQFDNKGSFGCLCYLCSKTRDNAATEFNR
jgi:hypothetical protein